MGARKLAPVAGAVISVAVAACGGVGSARQASAPLHQAAASHAPASPQSAAPAAVATAAPTAAPAAATVAASAVVVVSDSNPSGGQVPIKLVRDDGTLLASANVSTAHQWSLSPGPGAAYWVDGERLHRLDVAGHLSDLGAVEPDQNGRVVVSSDGSEWIYSTASMSGNGLRTNRLWHGGIGQATRLLAERTNDPMHPTPGFPTEWVYSLKSWTPAGVVAVREPAGGCGCGPFDMETVSGSSLLFDPETGAGTPLGTDPTCPLSGAGLDATAVCFHYKSGGHGEADDLRVLLRDGTAQHFSLSGTTQGGDAAFDATGATLAYATVPSNQGCGDWMSQTTTRLLDVRSGNAHALGPRGLQPDVWTSADTVVGTLRNSDGTDRVVSIDVHTGAVRTLMQGQTLFVVGSLR